jgi:hypothetical protein
VEWQGADVAMPTTHAVDEGHAAGARDAGTTAGALAKLPGRGDGSQKPYPRVVKLLGAAERGAWRQRREWKERGDAAMVSGAFLPSRGRPCWPRSLPGSHTRSCHDVEDGKSPGQVGSDYQKAVECYESALGAVLQVGTWTDRSGRGALAIKWPRQPRSKVKQVC